MYQLENQKKLGNLLEQLAHTQGYYKAFNQLLDFAICNLCIKSEIEIITNPYPTLKPPLQKVLIECFKLLGELMEHYNDALGDLFMEHISYGKNGQFFTPVTICDFMAKINGIDEMASDQTVCDPACGSGRMFLSAAKLNRNLKFYGSDIDLTCVKMAVINMAYNGLVSEIAHMNALSMEHWASFHTSFEPVTKIPFIIITGPQKSNVIQAIHEVAKQTHTSSNSFQTTLF